MGRTATTVVVGGGCSGALTAVQLLRHTEDRVVLVDPGGRPGRGLAYGTTDETHLLNSRAATMSADPEDPYHFVAWASRRAATVSGTAFAIRRDYGSYLEQTLDAAAAAHPGRFQHRRAYAVDVAGTDRPTVALDDGAALAGHRVVLAFGHAAPAVPAAVDPRALAHPGFVADPWRRDALHRVRLDAPVLLLGTGLTAVDVALSLVGRGLCAPIHAVSRHGLLPLAHTEIPAVSLPCARPVAQDLRGLVRELRARATRAEWRGVIDSLRPFSNSVWSGLSTAERDRFLRHLARLWEVHRHRMAPQVAILIRGLVSDGMLSVRRAHLARVAPAGAGFEVTFRSGARWRVGTVINCTGPGGADRTALGAALIADGTARPDPLGLGLDVDLAGRLVAATGRVHENVWVVGPPRRGQWWETTAVPEIRAQAAQVARACGREPAGTVPVAA